MVLNNTQRPSLTKFSQAVSSCGLNRTYSDHSIFVSHNKKGTIVLAVYVNDIVITGTDSEGKQL